ncbi:hypothetical protein SynBIOSU31_01991 [Synechococcus sp. BIOS-U3-1]|nr:hypothetical protein SynBIOSU31_01991 [Synechococcus sp. BIOS-U3-1]
MPYFNPGALVSFNRLGGMVPRGSALLQNLCCRNFFCFVDTYNKFKFWPVTINRFVEAIRVQASIRTAVRLLLRVSLLPCSRAVMTHSC